MKRTLSICVMLAAVFALSACSDNVTSPDADNSFAAASSVDAELKPGPMTIAEEAQDRGFSLLLAAVNHIAATNPDSEVVAGLLNTDQYTVFAPTDDAFLALVVAVQELLNPEILENDGPFVAIDDLLGAGTIEAVVSYHVVEGRRSSRSVLPRRGERQLQTLLDGGTFSVNSTGLIDGVGSDAQIAPADVSASNGIIHVIDAVLLPIVLDL